MTYSNWDQNGKIEHFYTPLSKRMLRRQGRRLLCPILFTLGVPIDFFFFIDHLLSFFFFFLTHFWCNFIGRTLFYLIHRWIWGWHWQKDKLSTLQNFHCKTKTDTLTEPQVSGLLMDHPEETFLCQ